MCWTCGAGRKGWATSRWMKSWLGGAALDDAIARQLSAAVCGDMLMGSARLSLGRVEAAARTLALVRFEEVAWTCGGRAGDGESSGRRHAASEQGGGCP